MKIARRDVMIGGLAGTLLAVAKRPAWALTEAEATAHVQAAIDEVLELVRSTTDPAVVAPKFREILERRAAMPQIAKFAAGRSWRDMSEDQQARFADAFTDFVAQTYARRFSEYSGETVRVGEVTDAGNRGLIVSSRVSQPGGQPVLVDWLVSDRPGRIVIADIVIEGVSLIVTQREEVGAMLDKRGGDVDQLIADLQTG